MEGKRFFLDGAEVTKERAEEFTNETLMCINSKGLDWVIDEMRRLQYEGDYNNKQLTAGVLQNAPTQNK